MLSSRKELLKALIESNQKRIYLILERNHLRSIDNKTDLPHGEFQELERLIDLNYDLLDALDQEQAIA